MKRYFAARELYLNGKPVPRGAGGHVRLAGGARVVDYQRSIETLPGGCEHAILTLDPGLPLNDTADAVVPPGHYFMMGDNRDNSLNSRVPAAAGGMGFVPAENLVGRAEVVLFSIKPRAGWSEAVAHPGELRLSRLLDRVE